MLNYMAKCDRCLQFCDLYKLAQLHKEYRLPNIVDVCPSCRKELDDYKGKLLDDIDVKMREKVGKYKPGFFRKLFNE